jgi:hypothetical protein
MDGEIATRVITHSLTTLPRHCCLWAEVLTRQNANQERARSLSDLLISATQGMHYAGASAHDFQEYVLLTPSKS